MSLFLLNRRSFSSTVSSLPSPWEMIRNFNSGPAGASVNNSNTDGFSGAAGTAVYTTEQVREGSFAAKTTVNFGSTAFGEWGGYINFTDRAYKGDEIWIDMYVYWPTSFDLEAARLNSKFLRVRTRSADDTENKGYNDLYLNSAVGYPSAFQYIKEGVGTWFPDIGLWTDLTKNTWHRVTWFLKLDNVAASSGGTGRIKVWLNNQLIGDENGTRTLTDATDFADALYVFTYWNNGAPATMSNYVDDIKIAKNVTPAWASTLQ